MARSGVALCLAMVFAALELGSCLKCFQCDSMTQPDCKDPFTASKYMTDCQLQDTFNFNRQFVTPLFQALQEVPGAPRYCHKLVLQSGAVIRTCLDSTSSQPNRTCQLLETMSVGTALVTNQGRALKHCSVCDRDLCNGAGSVTASLPLAAVTALVTYVYLKM